MSRTLNPEDRISHYRVVGPLGAGGMGEVYRARDQNLPRDVALKILPPELVLSEERVRRFTLEAESASSLNHPHIVTIYEIGEDRVQGAESDSSPLHYISMELVSGKTLAAKIHEEKSDLKTLLGWLAQAAEGVAKAHAAGIVHRDLKPGNIMVTSDGYAKVLDFGLAKLTERQVSDPAFSAAATMTAGEHTSEGTALGTVDYMAPEQVRGQVVDARADVFSFGVILYEAATRTRPFTADSKVETMHRILHDVPAPIETTNPEVPAELRRLIRRCLAKDPHQRLDSMRTLALELREIVDEYDALSASANSGSSGRVAPPRKARKSGIALAVAAVVLLGGWLAWRRPWESEPPAKAQPQWKQLTFVGNVMTTDLSADGKTIAYVADAEGSRRWMVQDVSGGQAIEIHRGLRAFALQWTNGGNGVLVSGLDSDSTARASIIPRMGGQGTTVPASQSMRLSADGATLAYWRSSLNRIAVMPVAGGDTSAIFVKPKITWLLDVGWSPNGSSLYYDVQDEGHRSIWTTSRDGRRQSKVYEDSRMANLTVRWAPSGKALYCIRQSGQRGELVKIYLNHDGSLAAQAPRVLVSSPGLQGDDFAISSDGHRLICMRGAAHNNLWLWEPAIAGKGGTRRSLTQGTAYLQNPTLSPDGNRVAFLSNQSGSDNIHVLSLVDGSVNQITFLDHDVSRVVWSPDGKELAFSAIDRDTLRVWRVAARGGAPLPLDRCVLGDRRNLTWSPGKLTYGLPHNRNFDVVDPVSGIQRPLVPNDSVGWMFCPTWSPDGKHVAVMWNRGPAAMRDGSSMRGTWIVSTEDTTQRLLLYDRQNSYHPLTTRWSADGSAIYVFPNEPPWRVMRVAYPRGDTTTVLRLPVEEDRTTSGMIDFTPELRRVVYAEGENKTDVWLLEHFDPEVK